MQEATKNISQRKKRLFLIDGYGFVFRAFHALPPIKTSKGVPVGAIYGFVNMLMKLKTMIEKDDSDSYLAAVFDAGAKTFRDDMYEHYKANRDSPPDDLIAQFPIIREAVRAMNIKGVELENYEADDLIATYTKQAKALGMDVTIVSSDKDLMQLIEPGVKMYDPVKSSEIGEEQVMAKFGVKPDKVTDVLALIGDSSDNVPGVPGIGPKTAAELIGQYGSLENLLDNLDNVKQAKRAETLKNNIENARLSKKLVELHLDVPVPCKIEEFEYKHFDEKYLVQFLKTYEFRSLLSRFDKHAADEIAKLRKPAAAQVKSEVLFDEKNFSLFNSATELKKWQEAQNPEYGVIFHLDADKEKTYLTVGYKNKADQFIAAGIAFADNSGPEAGFDMFAAPAGFRPAEAAEIFRNWLIDESLLKISHNSKNIHLMFNNAGLNMKPLDDIMLISNILDSTRHKHDLESLANKYYDIDFPFNLPLDNKILFTKLQVIHSLHATLKSRLFAEKMVRVYELLERPLIEVLSDMEKIGALVDKKELKILSDYFTVELKKLEADIFSLTGKEFNIGSPKQLSEVLFKDMGLESGKKSKTGSFTTGADILEKLALQGHIIAEKILEWRQFSKLKSTYTDALINQIDPLSGRVHTHYAMASTSTGRLSSQNPNLQNIPIKSEEGRKIRKAFIAAPGNRLIGADYSQIELRLLAHMADMPILKEAFKNGQDIHNITAQQVFGVTADKVDASLRRAAKTINFGIIYGQSAFGLARQLGISRGDAAKYIDAYFEKYPGILEYMEKTKNFARENLYVTTLFGRKCHLNGLMDRNQGIRGNAERAAINAPLQGTAADIIKKAMIDIHKYFLDQNMQTKLLVQVHDELIFESPEKEVESAMPVIRKIMENVVILSVPLVVEAKHGGNWGEIH